MMEYPNVDSIKNAAHRITAEPILNNRIWLVWQAHQTTAQRWDIQENGAVHLDNQAIIQWKWLDDVQQCQFTDTNGIATNYNLYSYAENCFLLENIADNQQTMFWIKANTIPEFLQKELISMSNYNDIVQKIQEAAAEQFQRDKSKLILSVVSFLGTVGCLLYMGYWGMEQFPQPIRVGKHRPICANDIFFVMVLGGNFIGLILMLTLPKRYLDRYRERVGWTEFTAFWLNNDIRLRVIPMVIMFALLLGMNFGFYALFS